MHCFALLSYETNLQIGESAPSRTEGGQKSVWTWWKIAHTGWGKKAETCCLMLVKLVLHCTSKAGSARSCTQQWWLGAAWARCWLGCCLCLGVTTVQCSTGVQTWLAGQGVLLDELGGRLQHQLGKGKNQVPCLTQGRDRSQQFSSVKTGP